MKRLVFVSLGLVLLIGCGGPPRETGTFKGTITYKGQPVNNATLQLYAVKGLGGSNDAPTTVTTDDKGNFNVADVTPGDYVIVVAPLAETGIMSSTPPAGGDPKMAAAAAKQGQQAPTIQIPPKYTSRASSNLQTKIEKGQTKPVELKLED